MADTKLTSPASFSFIPTDSVFIDSSWLRYRIDSFSSHDSMYQARLIKGRRTCHLYDHGSIPFKDPVSEKWFWLYVDNSLGYNLSECREIDEKKLYLEYTATHNRPWSAERSLILANTKLSIPDTPFVPTDSVFVDSFWIPYRITLLADGDSNVKSLLEESGIPCNYWERNVIAFKDLVQEKWYWISTDPKRFIITRCRDSQRGAKAERLSVQIFSHFGQNQNYFNFANGKLIPPIMPKAPTDSIRFGSAWIPYRVESFLPEDSSTSNLLEQQFFRRCGINTSSFLPYFDVYANIWRWLTFLGKDNEIDECIDKGAEFHISSRSMDSTGRFHFQWSRLIGTRLHPFPKDSICGQAVPKQHTAFVKKLTQDPEIGRSVMCSQNGFTWEDRGHLDFYPFNGRSIRLDPYVKGPPYALWGDSACTYFIEEYSYIRYSICEGRIEKIKSKAGFSPLDTPVEWKPIAKKMGLGEMKYYKNCFQNTTTSGKTRTYCPTPTSLDSFGVSEGKFRQLGRIHENSPP
ncbi:MAG: hypothetical protein H6686_02715 [Fibrobacteria bacterium]|nr:hypothetical protein [Fibrobacteria bacterium]